VNLHPQPLPPFGLEAVLKVLFSFTTGPWAIFTLVIEIAGSIWYLRAVFVLRGKNRTWPIQRSLFWVSAMLLLSVAFQSGIPIYAEHVFTVHIIQHLALMIAIPMLLAASSPVTLFMQTADYEKKVKILKLFHNRKFKNMFNPIVTILLNNGIMFWFFLGHGIVIAMNHADLMDFVNFIFLFLGCLAWWPIVASDFIGKKKYSHPMRVLLAASGMPFDAFLAIALLPGAAIVSIAPNMYSLQSVQTGAAVFWITIMLLSGIGALIPLVQWLSFEKRSTTRDAELLKVARKVKATSKLGWWSDEIKVDPDGLITVPWATEEDRRNI
jgi:putative copper resistance protein D